ncbi:MAG TPA: peptidylprolyl isomerase [Gemmatimonadaceae bacterium]|nr:peptidylprolyl isomerase [Gemmatimonadaceae bacterium]
MNHSTMKKSVLAAIGAAFLINGCNAIKDAMSAHTDVVAKAGGQELTVSRLATLIASSKAPLRKDVATAITDAWVNYHLVAEAAVNNDSLTDTKKIDNAMWAVLANVKAKKWYDQVSKTWKAPDSTQAEASYNSNTMLAADHILLLTQDTTPAGKATVKKKIDALRAQVTPANFAELARKNSQDPQSAVQGGSLGVFPRGAMVKEFDQATAALKPGEISPVIQTQYGYHIIRRPTFSSIKDRYVQAMQQGGLQAAESTYLAGLEAQSKLEVKPGTAATVRGVVEYPNGHRNDKTVLATSSIGKFTAADLARWMETFPPQAQIAERVKAAPDSMLPVFVKNFVRNELVLHSADSAKLGPDAAQVADVRKLFATSLTNAWTALNLDPKGLATAAKSKDERAKLASQRVEEYITKLLAQQAQYVDVTQPVQNVLRDKYDYTINAETLDQVLLQAAKVRLGSDSTAKAGQPGSVVPVPNQDTAKKR